MIRTAYSIAPARQLRDHLELATRRTRRALFDRCRALRSRTEPVETADDSYAAYLQRREILQQSRSLYNAFETQVDNLIGAICLAAHEGNNPHTERDFAEARDWFLVHYNSVRPNLVPFFEAKKSDGASLKKLAKPTDAVEAVFLPPTLADLLDGDNGTLISVLDNVQEATDFWHQSLRQEEQIIL